MLDKNPTSSEVLGIEWENLFIGSFARGWLSEVRNLFEINLRFMREKIACSSWCLIGSLIVDLKRELLNAILIANQNKIKAKNLSFDFGVWIKTSFFSDFNKVFSSFIFLTALNSDL